MSKKFNITGTCISEKHFMVDISGKINKIIDLIENSEYFTINRPRQYGKTTTIFNIEKVLRNNPDYLVSSISFEGIGDIVFNDEKSFSPFVLKLIADGFGIEHEEIQNYIIEESNNVENLDTLSKAITRVIRKYKKKIVLLIDEVDKSGNNQLFLSFLGMLRNKYLLRNQGKDYTFQSVILVGVHDIKTLKLKIRPDAEQKYNSPWNIATEFKVDLSFNPQEISTMLIDYVNEKKIKMDIKQISERIYHYTRGYPFLVSRICKEIDEEISPYKTEKKWTNEDVDEATKIIIDESNTNFDSLIKNIENNKELYEFIKNVILGTKDFNFVINNPLINIGYIYGIFDRGVNKKLIIHNKIYEEVITDYITSKINTNGLDNGVSADVVKSSFIKPDGRLNIEKVLLKFQEVIKEKYSKSDALKSKEFLEKELRLLFLVFLKPIINGIGFCFKEVESSEEKRMDIVIIFRDEKFVVELKIWRGIEYHKEGISRLNGYMQREGVQKAYMLIMDKTRHKEFSVEQEEGMMMVWV
ncbi:MAG: AAA family ATPase [Bacteroidia bacterium]|nr:AAA family ATPase [Bacteroidia bacterium]